MVLDYTVCNYLYNVLYTCMFKQNRSALQSSYNIIPIPVTFIYQVIVDAVLFPSHHKNCVDDLDTFLIQLGSLQNKAAVSPAVPVVSSYEVMLAKMPPTARCVFSVCTSQENDGLSKQEKNIVAYISGYMVRKLCKCMCEDCFLYCTTGADDCGEDLDFITVKRYEEAKDGLISPSLSLVRN